MSMPADPEDFAERAAETFEGVDVATQLIETGDDELRCEIINSLTEAQLRRALFAATVIANESVRRLNESGA